MSATKDKLAEAVNAWRALSEWDRAEAVYALRVAHPEWTSPEARAGFDTALALLRAATEAEVPSVRVYEVSSAGCAHVYPGAWSGVVPPTCLKCGR